jgi:hypothetical protein
MPEREIWDVEPRDDGWAVQREGTDRAESRCLHESRELVGRWTDQGQHQRVVRYDASTRRWRLLRRRLRRADLVRNHIRPLLRDGQANRDDRPHRLVREHRELKPHERALGRPATARTRQSRIKRFVDP